MFGQRTEVGRLSAFNEARRRQFENTNEVRQTAYVGQVPFRLCKIADCARCMAAPASTHEIRHIFRIMLIPS